MARKGGLLFLVEQLSKQHADLSPDLLWQQLRGAIDPGLLVSNLAEALRAPEAAVCSLLAEAGLGDMVALAAAARPHAAADRSPTTGYEIPRDAPPCHDLIEVTTRPPHDAPIPATPAEADRLALLVENISDSAGADAFAQLYRADVLEYLDSFLTSDAKLIDDYMTRAFAADTPRYLVNSGIGANEQYNHFVASIYDRTKQQGPEWLIVSSPRQLSRLPADATVDNTLFMEFSRSGVTEETVKIHEYTPRDARRIVFANSGPLRALGERDGNLLLPFPDHVSGRFGRNKTPILLAPMYVCGMNVRSFWSKINETVNAFDLSEPSSLPAQLAQFIWLFQRHNAVNQVYLGCNDDELMKSGDELTQFWNEGVNKRGNDISMTGFFGLLRDSHANIEGLLANAQSKLAIFLLRERLPVPESSMVQQQIDPVNPAHAGLVYGEEESILAEANFQRFSELMPAIRILVRGEQSLDHAAVLGQLWADTTFYYSRLMGIDPGSNPEVKAVRERSAKLLARSATAG